MHGALLGFLMDFMLRPLATPVVFVYAMLQLRYPWWMITPDDLPSHGPHFGYYEATVRKVYERFGKRIGDFYWLGWRNVLYGLRYRLKPAFLMPQPDPIRGGIYNYAHLYYGVDQKTLTPLCERIRKGRAVMYRVGKFRCVKVNYFTFRGSRYGGIFGWKIDSIVDDPFTSRTLVNMEARPTCVIIKAIG